MEQVIADLVSIFRLQNFTQEVEIYYIGSVYGLSLPYLKLNNDVKQFCTCVNKIKQTIIDLFLIVAVILDGRVGLSHIS